MSELSSLNSTHLHGFPIHTVGPISPEIPGLRDFLGRDQGLLVPVPNSQGGPLFTQTKQLYIKTLLLLSAQWRERRKQAKYLHPSVSHAYLIIGHFLQGHLLALNRTHLGNAVWVTETKKLKAKMSARNQIFMLDGSDQNSLEVVRLNTGRLLRACYRNPDLGRSRERTT